MIEKMNFLSITGPKADIDRVVNTYLCKYEIHLENALSELTTVESLTPFLEVNPYRDALNSINTIYEELKSPPATSNRSPGIETALSTVKEIRSQADLLYCGKCFFNTRTFAGSGRRAFQLFINGIDGIQRISVRVDLKKRCQVFYCGQFRECVLQMNFVLAQVGVYNPVDICLRTGDA